MTLMVMWSQIFDVGRLSSAKGSGQESMTEGAREAGGSGSTRAIGSEATGVRPDRERRWHTLRAPDHG
jgi:hypothetical protein